jgi:hypothetical protein
MKGLTLLLPFAIFAFALNAAAQNNDVRVNAARAAIDQTREYRGDSEFRQDRELQRANNRVGYEIDQLNREVRRLRYDIRTTHTSLRIRDRFDRLTRDTDRLTAIYRQNRLRLSEASRRAQNLRAEVVRIRQLVD